MNLTYIFVVDGTEDIEINLLDITNKMLNSRLYSNIIGMSASNQDAR